MSESSRWYQHPATLYRVAALEACERFSFFGMRTMLVLFLIGAPATGGFGWDAARALRLHGAYVALVYVAPLVGGYLIDRYIEARRSLPLGLFVLCLGHLSLLGPWLFPGIAAAATGYPISAILHAEGVRLGDWHVDAATLASMERATRELVVGIPAQQAALSAASSAYSVVSATFYAALTLIVVGTGLYRPASSAIVAGLYSSDVQREAGFAIFVATLNVGLFAAPVLAGGLGETYSWPLGLGLSALGVVVANGGWWAWRESIAVQSTVRPACKRRPPGRWTERSEQERHNLLLLLALLIFTALWMTAAEQPTAYLSVYLAQDLDRTVSGFSVPVTWLQGVSSIFLVALSLPMASLWSRLDARGRNPHVITKFIASAAVMGVAFLPLMTLAHANDKSAVDGSIAVPVILLFFFLFVLSELLIIPFLFAAVGKLAPHDLVSFAMGGVYLSWAVGSWLAGNVGAAAVDIPVSQFFGAVVVCMTFLAFALYVVAKRLLPAHP